MSIGVVVLAAGQGTRMHSDIPKVAQPLAGRPLIAWVLDALAAAGSDHTVVVVGHEAEAVRGVLPPGVTAVVQAERLGTGRRRPGGPGRARPRLRHRGRGVRRHAAAPARAGAGAGEGADRRGVARGHHRDRGAPRRRRLRTGACAPPTAPSRGSWSPATPRPRSWPSGSSTPASTPSTGRASPGRSTAWRPTPRPGSCSSRTPSRCSTARWRSCRPATRRWSRGSTTSWSSRPARSSCSGTCGTS